MAATLGNWPGPLRHQLAAAFAVVEGTRSVGSPWAHIEFLLAVAESLAVVHIVVAAVVAVDIP